MADMTDEEYAELDRRLTRTTPKLDLSRPGIFMRLKMQRQLLASLDDESAAYVSRRAAATQRSPAEVIGDLVHREIEAEAAA